jgi:hypothetical protein
MTSIAKQDLSTFLDLLGVVFSHEFSKTKTPTLTDPDRYMADVTFIGLKLLKEEAEFLESCFENRPIECRVPAEDDSKAPIPNDLYNLKLSLLLTKALRKGFEVISAEVALDPKRKEAVDRLTKKLTQLTKSSIL